MVKKLVSYAIALVGLLIVILSFGKVRTSIFPAFPAYLTDNILLGAGIILVALGALTIGKGASSSKHEEVPIYEGKNVVGFRRMKK